MRAAHLAMTRSSEKSPISARSASSDTESGGAPAPRACSAACSAAVGGQYLRARWMCGMGAVRAV